MNLTDLERELDDRDGQPARFLEWLVYALALALIVGPVIALWLLW
jgi:hypothetical protein